VAERKVIVSRGFGQIRGLLPDGSGKDYDV